MHRPYPDAVRALRQVGRRRQEQPPAGQLLPEARMAAASVTGTTSPPGPRISIPPRSPSAHR